MTFLRVHDLHMSRDGGTVLDLPSLEVTKGQSLLVTGPSGSGKTTLLHILAGLLRPTSGDVFFRDQSYAAMSEAERDALRRSAFGFIFQQLHLIRHLSALDNIRLAAPKADALALLAALGLEGKGKKRISDLSHGEAQRVAIARAVANRPAIIFADEPTSSLDDANAASVMALLRAQAAETGAALIVTTHDARIMPGFDATITLNNGKMIP